MPEITSGEDAVQYQCDANDECDRRERVDILSVQYPSQQRTAREKPDNALILSKVLFNHELTIAKIAFGLLDPTGLKIN